MGVRFSRLPPPPVGHTCVAAARAYLNELGARESTTSETVALREILKKFAVNPGAARSLREMFDSSPPALVQLAKLPQIRGHARNFDLKQAFPQTSLTSEAVDGIVQFLRERTGITTYPVLNEIEWSPSPYEAGVAIGTPIGAPTKPPWINEATGDTATLLFLETGARHTQINFGDAYYYSLGAYDLVSGGALVYAEPRPSKKSRPLENLSGRYSEVTGFYGTLHSVGPQPAIVLDVVKGGRVKDLTGRDWFTLRQNRVTPETIMEWVQGLPHDNDRAEPRREAILAKIAELRGRAPGS